MFKLLFLSLIIASSVLAQSKPVLGMVKVTEVKDTARYYYYYSPRFHIITVDDRFDAWHCYVIDSTYFPGIEQYPDGTYRRWRRASNGKLLTMVKIRPVAMREIMMKDTATYLPHWSGEIPNK